MNKGELIAKIAEAGLSKKDAGLALDAAIAAMGVLWDWIFLQ